jgi:poly-gamma-glutamate capsule biosynthesis protein CapA/YwtB (metallophosphatase superfamily)
MKQKQSRSDRMWLYHFLLTAFILFLVMAISGCSAANALGGTGRTASGNSQVPLTAPESQNGTQPQAGSGISAAGTGNAQAPAPSQPDPEPPVTSITISAAGDCTLGTDIHFGYDGTFPAAFDAAGNPALFLSGVQQAFAHDDLTLVNMEGPLTLANKREEKTFAFKGDPSYVEVLRQGSVEAASMANNHSYDYGEKAYWDTFSILADHGITPFGYGDSQLIRVKGIPIGLIGINDLTGGAEAQLMTELARMKQQGARLIIVYFHWGTELAAYPDGDQRYLAHTAIDHGAHLVLGSHPHVLQGVETYKGRQICYSLGNFCFGGNSNPMDKDSMIFQQTFYFTKDMLTGSDSGSILPCRISSVSSYNDYRPVILSGEEGARVMAKIRERSSF